jgi:hypothetical protein
MSGSKLPLCGAANKYKLSSESFMCSNFEEAIQLQTINSAFFKCLRKDRNKVGQCIFYKLQEILCTNRETGLNNILLESGVRLKQTVSIETCLTETYLLKSGQGDVCMTHFILRML